MSETTTATISDFLLARIAERERAAYGAGNGPAWMQQAVVNGRAFPMNDPALLVDECKALRRLVELHTGGHECRESIEHEDGYFGEGHPCTTIRLLASVHAGHEDYRAEWAL